MSGMLVRRIHEPEAARACYAVELAEPSGSQPAERIWLCASPIWKVGQFEALGFIGQSHMDRMRLATLLSTARGGAAS